MGRPKAMRFFEYSTVISNMASMAPTVSAHTSASAVCSWRSRASAAASPCTTTRSAGTEAGKEVAALGVGSLLGKGAGDDVHGDERARLDVATQLLGDDRGVDEAFAADAAATVGLGHEHGKPTDGRRLAEPRGVVAHR